MRKPLIAGNWKMNGSPKEGADLARGIAALGAAAGVDVAVYPPFLSIPGVVAELSGVDVGGQDLHPEATGAYTGNVSGEMLAAAGCTTVLVGHSERRQYEGEAGELLARKVRAALRAGLWPVFCCGETLAHREAGQTPTVVRSQLSEALGSLDDALMASVVIAYEPVWAIGTGRVATVEQAQEVHAAIRGWVANNWNDALAAKLRVLYGGSVKPANAAGLLAQPDIDGALVGGASLTADSFSAIVAAAGA